MLSLSVLTLAAAFSGGCWNAYNETTHAPAETAPDGLEIGAATVVAVRPDVLGAAAGLPVTAGTHGINGAQVVLQGSLVGVDRTWITLDDAGGERRWIRLEVVSWVSQATPPPDEPAAGG
jgi:hypothetical protein